MSSGFGITKKLRGSLPRVPFEHIARRILGTHYTLSLVICADALARRLNTEYRKKTYAPNVLSFPLSRTEGEIILNIRKAEREARDLGVSARTRIAFLFIHGCLHLTGLVHGKKMDRLEKMYLKNTLTL